MPKTKGATNWKLQEVEKVMRLSRTKKKLSASDPDFVNLCVLNLVDPRAVFDTSYAKYVEEPMLCFKHQRGEEAQQVRRRQHA